MATVVVGGSFKVESQDNAKWMQSMSNDMALLKERLDKVEKRINKDFCDIYCTIDDEEEKKDVIPAEWEKYVIGKKDVIRVPDSKSSIAKRATTSFATAHGGLGSSQVCWRLVKSKRLATVQCVWLFVCVLTFGYFLVYEWKRSTDSESEEFKPQKKSKVVNFGAEEEEYEMPYFSLLIKSPKSKGLQKVLSKVVDESSFNCRYYFDYNSSNTFRLSKPIVINYTSEYEEQSVNLWWINILPENPDPRSGQWYCTFSFTKQNFTEALFFVSRELNDINSGSFQTMPLAFEDSEAAIVSFDYTERVLQRVSNGGKQYEYEFISGISETYITKASARQDNVVLHIYMHPKVEYWEEYVDYTLEDAIAALGGILTILSTFFFWLAFVIATSLRTNPWQMGILPQLSFVFANLEKFLLLENRLVEMKLIPRPSRKRFSDKLKYLDNDGILDFKSEIEIR